MVFFPFCCLRKAPPLDFYRELERIKFQREFLQGYTCVSSTSVLSSSETLNSLWHFASFLRLATAFSLLSTQDDIIDSSNTDVYEQGTGFFTGCLDRGSADSFSRGILFSCVNPALRNKMRWRTLLLVLGSDWHRDDWRRMREKFPTARSR